MIARLAETDYPHVRPVFEALRYNLVVDSVIDGNTPAWVFVDDVARPGRGLIWDRQDAMLIAGAPDDAFSHDVARVIGDEIIPDAQARSIPVLSLQYDTAAWEPVIEQTILAGRQAERLLRRTYSFDRLRVDWRAALPAGTEMRRIDRDLLDHPTLDNADQVAGWVDSFWRSHAAFVETGFGYCLAQGGAIASWCLTVFASGSNYEVGLATAPEYQGQGYATLVAAATIEHCLALGATPHWHCWEENVASQRVADKVGFTRPRTYPAYRFWL